MSTNEEVLRQVEAALVREVHLDTQRYRISMELADGALTMQGDLPDVACKKLALEAAASVPSVRGIVDRLHVIPTERMGDGAIRDVVCQLLLSDVDFRNCTLRVWVKDQMEMLRAIGSDSCGAIDVTVDDGIVTLSGQVISLSHKRLAGVMAWWTPGCRDVINGLEVDPPEEDSDDEVTDALRLVLETDPCVPASQIGIRTRNHVVTLAGIVATQEEKRRAEFDAWALFAVDRVFNEIEVRP
jgi:osmotically-inducible protein OsmY